MQILEVLDVPGAAAGVTATTPSLGGRRSGSCRWAGSVRRTGEAERDISVGGVSAVHPYNTVRFLPRQGRRLEPTFENITGHCFRMNWSASKSAALGRAAAVSGPCFGRE